jgi:hypothetical protein
MNPVTIESIFILRIWNRSVGMIEVVVVQVAELRKRFLN